MNLSANYNVGLRKLFGLSAPKIETIFGGPSAFALANLFKLASPVRGVALTCSAKKMSPGHFFRFRSHAALSLKNLLESLNPSTLRIGSL